MFHTKAKGGAGNQIYQFRTAITNISLAVSPFYKTEPGEAWDEFPAGLEPSVEHHELHTDVDPELGFKAA